MGDRLGLIWVGLLAAIESTDVLTTAFDRARGSIESMPISAAILNQGGLALFWSLKLALVAAGAAAVLLAIRWVRYERPHARALYVYVLSALRVTTVVLAIVSLNNAVLLRTIQ